MLKSRKSYFPHKKNEEKQQQITTNALFEISWNENESDSLKVKHATNLRMKLITLFIYVLQDCG